MGLLIDGVWRDKWYETRITNGRFVRTDAQFRNWITADGSAQTFSASFSPSEACWKQLLIRPRAGECQPPCTM